MTDLDRFKRLVDRIGLPPKGTTHFFSRSFGEATPCWWEKWVYKGGGEHTVYEYYEDGWRILGTFRYDLDDMVKLTIDMLLEAYVSPSEES